MTKLTKHGINRINQRIGSKYEEKILIKKAKKYGYPIDYFTGEFYDYLLNKSNKGGKIKIYDNMIYILSSNKKNFITVYPIPNKFLPIEEYLININMCQLLYHPLNFINKDVLITTVVGKNISGILKKVTSANDKTVSISIQTYSDSTLTLSIEELQNIKVDNEHMYNELLNVFGDFDV